jgi:hypothetical protein
MIEVVREAKCAPDSVQSMVTRAGGLNRYGEPNYRVVWGWSRLAWIGGKWVDYDEHGNAVREVVELRQEPKYVPHDRWHVERWTPPEAYGSPEAWYEETTEREDGILIPALGPYPTRGDYEHSFTLEGEQGEFLPLTPSVCLAVVRAVEWCRGTTAGARRAALASREERIEKEWEMAANTALGI